MGKISPYNRTENCIAHASRISASGRLRATARGAIDPVSTVRADSRAQQELSEVRPSTYRAHATPLSRASSHALKRCVSQGMARKKGRRRLRQRCGKACAERVNVHHSHLHTQFHRLIPNASSDKSGLLMSQNPCRLAIRMAVNIHPILAPGCIRDVPWRMIGKTGAQNSGVRNFQSNF